jgi:surface protein
MFSFCTSLETAQLFDTSSVTSINSMFRGCTLLETIPLFDTSNVTDMMYVFNGCSSLTFLPLFNTSKATNMTYFASNCYKVQTGALAIYQQASTQTNPPTSHTGTFVNCGRDTTTGAAELAQIPSNWK